MEDAKTPIESDEQSPVADAPEVSAARVEEEDEVLDDEVALKGEAAALAVFGGVDHHLADFVSAPEAPEILEEDDSFSPPLVAGNRSENHEPSIIEDTSGFEDAGIVDSTSDDETPPVVEGVLISDDSLVVVESSVVEDSPPASGGLNEENQSTSPWDATTDQEIAFPEDTVEPQPPAVAFAPGFLAVDEDGNTVPDEAVEAIEAELNRPIPKLKSIKLETGGILSPSEIEAIESATPNGGAAWTIPLICFGIAILACCLLIPQADENRKLVWEREKLRRDLDQIQAQVDINDRFLTAMTEDVVLTQRLAQRQMNVVRSGTAVLQLDANSRNVDSSPFQLVNVPPPAPLPDYIPYGGKFAAICRNPKSQLYLTGLALLCIATGLVMGGEDKSRQQAVNTRLKCKV